MEILIVFLFIILTSFLPTTNSLNPDGLSLLALKSAITSDPTQILTKWSDTDPTPCNWPGITCDDVTSTTVTSITLPNRHFTGYIPYELGALTSLQSLTLHNNNFSGPIPTRLFTSTTSSLTSLDLSQNSLTGPIPTNLPTTLISLDLSSNLLTGSLPTQLSTLTSLTGTLNLSYNLLSGSIPVSFAKFPVLVSLDLRHNNLTGMIPQEGALLNQGPTAFTGNPSLCGFPLNNACPEATDPNPPLNPAEIVVGNSNREPDLPSGDGSMMREREDRNEGSRVKLKGFSLPVICGVFVVVGAVVVSILVARRRRTHTTITKSMKDVEKSGEMKGGYQMEIGMGGGGGSSVSESDGGRQSGKFVVIDEGFDLDLEDLLRASAYVVGKSRTGIVYKVVVGGGASGGSGGSGKFVGGGVTGTVVAVRRLSEGEDYDGMTWRMREFESEVESIGRVNHPNVVRLRAYYYASDEKLLVSDFVRGGSLYTALHGTPSNDSPPLSWSTRLKIAQGAARGLTHIHESSPKKHIHGNIKSSKILLDENQKPYISGFGLHRLLTPSSRTSSSSLHLLTTTTKLRPPHHHGLSSISINGSEILYPSSSSSTAYLAPEARGINRQQKPQQQQQQMMMMMSQKCDVYSFGIVLMEILTGQLPSGESIHYDGKMKHEGAGGLLLEEVVRKVFREERPLSEIIDPALLHEVHAKKQVLATFHVALSCTEYEPELRPRMRNVLESLEGIKY